MCMSTNFDENFYADLQQEELAEIEQKRVLYGEGVLEIHEALQNAKPSNVIDGILGRFHAGVDKLEDTVY